MRISRHAGYFIILAVLLGGPKQRMESDDEMYRFEEDAGYQEESMTTVQQVIAVSFIDDSDGVFPQTIIWSSFFQVYTSKL